MPWLLIHRAYQKSILQGRHPTGSKEGNPHSWEMKWAALTECSISCLPAASVIFLYTVKMFPDITSTLEKCSSGNMIISNGSDCRSFRIFFAFFYLVYINIFPEHYSLSNISFYVAVPQLEVLKQVSHLRLHVHVPVPVTLFSFCTLSPIMW